MNNVTRERVRMSTAEYVANTRAGKKLKGTATHPRLQNKTHINGPLQQVQLTCRLTNLHLEPTSPMRVNSYHSLSPQNNLRLAINRFTNAS